MRCASCTAAVQSVSDTDAHPRPSRRDAAVLCVAHPALLRIQPLGQATRAASAGLSVRELLRLDERLLQRSGAHLGAAHDRRRPDSLRCRLSVRVGWTGGRVDRAGADQRKRPAQDRAPRCTVGSTSRVSRCCIASTRTSRSSRSRTRSACRCPRRTGSQPFIMACRRICSASAPNRAHTWPSSAASRPRSAWIAPSRSHVGAGSR